MGAGRRGAGGGRRPPLQLASELVRAEVAMLSALSGGRRLARPGPAPPPASAAPRGPDGKAGEGRGARVWSRRRVRGGAILPRAEPWAAGPASRRLLSVGDERGARLPTSPPPREGESPGRARGWPRPAAAGRGARLSPRGSLAPSTNQRGRRARARRPPAAGMRGDAGGCAGARPRDAARRPDLRASAASTLTPPLGSKGPAGLWSYLYPGAERGEMLPELPARRHCWLRSRLRSSIPNRVEI